MEPSWRSAMSLIHQDSFLARLSLLSPNTLSHAAWGVIAKLMDGAIETYVGTVAVAVAVVVAVAAAHWLLLVLPAPSTCCVLPS